MVGRKKRNPLGGFFSIIIWVNQENQYLRTFLIINVLRLLVFYILYIIFFQDFNFVFSIKMNKSFKKVTYL